TRRRHQSASMTAAGSRSSRRSEISEVGLHNARPTRRPRPSRMSTMPAGPAGRRSTSLLYIHGWPCSQRRTARAETTALSVMREDCSGSTPRAARGGEAAEDHPAPLSLFLQHHRLMRTKVAMVASVVTGSFWALERRRRTSAERLAAAAFETLLNAI